MRTEKREVEVLDFEIVPEFEIEIVADQVFANSKLFYLFYKLRFYIGFINKLSSFYFFVLRGFLDLLYNYKRLH